MASDSLGPLPQSRNLIAGEDPAAARAPASGQAGAGPGRSAALTKVAGLGATLGLATRERGSAWSFLGEGQKKTHGHASSGVGALLLFSETARCRDRSGQKGPGGQRSQADLSAPPCHLRKDSGSRCPTSPQRPIPRSGSSRPETVGCSTLLGGVGSGLAGPRLPCGTRGPRKRAQLPTRTCSRRGSRLGTLRS